MIRPSRIPDHALEQPKADRSAKGTGLIQRLGNAVVSLIAGSGRHDLTI